MGLSFHLSIPVAEDVGDTAMRRGATLPPKDETRMTLFTVKIN